MLHPQCQSYLAGLRAGSIPCPLLASSFPAPPTALAPPVAWPHWDSDPGPDPAEKTKKLFFFSRGERTVPRGSCLPPGAAGAGEGRGVACPGVSEWRCRGRQCCDLGRSISPRTHCGRDTSVAAVSATVGFCLPSCCC